MNKFELTDNTGIFCGHTLHQVRYLMDIGGNIKAGDLGGWIEKEENLSQDGDAAVCGDAKVYGDVAVCGDATVYGNAKVFGDAKVFGNAKVCGNATVYGNAKVFGDAKVCGDATVYGNAEISQIYDLLVIGPIGSRRSYTSFYRTQDAKIFVSCGCFLGDINAFRNKVRETHACHPKHLAAYLNAADFAEKLIEGRA